MTSPAPDDLRAEEATVVHSLAALAREEGPRGFTFLDDEGAETVRTFAEVSREADRRAKQLLGRGLVRGDRIGLLLPDTWAFVGTFLGALRAGIVPVPMAPPLRVDTADAFLEGIARILGAAKAKLLVTDEEIAPLAWGLVGDVESLRAVARHDQLADAEADLPAVASFGPSDLAFLQFTSGSTGSPRGVRVTHGSLVANCHAIGVDGIGIRPDDVGVSWLPLYHDMGLIGFVLTTVRYRGATVFLPPLRFLMRPAIWMEAVSKYGASVSFAPNFAYALAVRRTDDPGRLDLRRMRVLGCGAEPIQPETLLGFVAHFAPAGLRPEALVPCYGMAEATLAMSFLGLEDELRVDVVKAGPYRDANTAVPAEPSDTDTLRFASCGPAMKGHVLEVRGEHGEVLPERAVGEIYFRGPSVADGYDGDPDATAATFTAHGIRTGDLGYLAGGEIHITGRKKDLLIFNGRNYDPQDVEKRVAEVEGIRLGNAVAFSVPGADTEKLVVAAETTAKDRDALGKAVQAHVRKTLSLAVADVVLLAPRSLPKTSSGKLQRRLARERYLAGTLDRKATRIGKWWSVARGLGRGLWWRARHRVAGEGGS